MTVRGKRAVLWLVSGLLLAAAAVIASAGLLLPAHAGSDLTKTVATAAQVRSLSSAIEPTLPPLPEFAKVWDLNLQRPLVDPPPAPPPVATPVTAAPAPPPLGLRLVGTAFEPVEPGGPPRSVALLATRAGSIEIAAMGQKVDDSGVLYEVVRIDAASATLRSGTQEVLLKLQEPTNR